MWWANMRETTKKEEPMCTFENEQSVVVCDSAIQQVRAAVSAAFGDGIRYTPIAGQGTRVEVPPSVNVELFQGVAHEAIAASQEKPGTSPEQIREEVETSNQVSPSTASAENT
jgi:hypothetical protein